MTYPVLAIVCIVLALVLGIVAVYIWMLKYPQSCQTGCGRAPSFMNGGLCLSVLETYSDPTLPTPSQLPYISNFSQTSGAGAPFCTPTWYAFRYVRNADGGYGGMSPWSGSDQPGSDGTPMPIFAGAATFPVAPGTTPSFPTGSASCTFNMPSLQLISPLDLNPQYMQPNGYTLNIHRQVGYVDGNGQYQGFDPNGEGTVVGSFMIAPPGSTPIATFIDAAFNPNSTTRSSCC